MNIAVYLLFRFTMIKKVNGWDLKIGIYVCQLDPPCLETAFIFHNFLIKSKKQIKNQTLLLSSLNKEGG
ncbi:MAG: DUF3391 domain-containing protein [Nitrospinae bacterium]|nr:DUF3391 domain-containing protein [Nitrospinota bacterium]